MADYYKITVTLKSGESVSGNVSDDDGDDVTHVIDSVISAMKNESRGSMNIGSTFIDIREVAAIKVKHLNKFIGWLLT